MKTITFHLDFVSPYAWLAFDALPRALEGLEVEVIHRPVLLGALLRELGSLGPAEIPPKRDWTYRQALWLGRSQGTPLRMPARHPFNPVSLLRLALATDPRGRPDAAACEAVFRHVWESGEEPLAPDRLAALERRLAPQLDPEGPEVRALLRANTAEAIARKVFGVPTLEVDGRLFWGLDSLPMLRAFLAGDPWFAGPDWASVTRLPWGLPRDR